MARRRGRPRLDEHDPSVTVSVAVPGRQYDHYCAEARRHGLTLPEVLRRKLRAAAERRAQGFSTV